MAEQIVAGQIARKTLLCESMGFDSEAKKQIWRDRLRKIRVKENNIKLFTGRWLSAKEVKLLIDYFGEPPNYVKQVS